MAPRPAKNFQQTQPITTALRNVCEHYPTDTCLRELLQNADDAGASEIEYVLDTKSYTKGPFLYDALLEYQGPALSVRNDSVFTDDDFSSLASVGASKKRYDASKTGKFGRGFNSVYHWTDGPWIYSRNWLLMLDPHEGWSKQTGQPGGPTWDVVEHGDSVEMQNHLETFRIFDLDTSQEIDQTIIRIPLRTHSQAAISKIVERETTTDDIKKALEQFGDEMKEGGLIFLKFIRKIILRVDTDVMATVQLIDDDSTSLKTRDEIPSDFRRLYMPGLEESDHISKTFELNVVYSAGTYSSTERYLIQHTMRKSSGDQELDAWAREQKLFPWTAIAAPLHDKKGSSFRGRLYSTLRLPILTNHPVHIHGMWSITPDRGRLSSSGQSDDRWNHFMFRHCVSASWTSLLLHRNQLSWQNEAFGLWPQIISRSTDIWCMLDEWVIDKIISEKSSIWNTSSGCVAIDHGLFSARGAKSEVYASALAQIHLPAVFLEISFLEKVKERAILASKDLPMIEPACVRDYIRRHPSFVSDDASSKVLEYCLLDAIDFKGGSKEKIYDEMRGLRLWPLLSSPSLSDLKDLVLPRNVEEMNLFQSSGAHQTVDLHRLTSSVRGLLMRDITLVPEMRFRGLSDLKQDWPDIYPVRCGLRNPDALVQRPIEFDSILRSVWSWICERQKDHNRQSLSLLGDLWLLPVNKIHIRLFAPKLRPPPMLIVTTKEPLYQVMIDIASKNNSAAATLLDTELLPLEAVELLRGQISGNPQVGGASVRHPESFLTWLAASRKSLAEISDEYKNSLLLNLELVLIPQHPSIKQKLLLELTSKVKTLPLFSKIRSATPYNRTIARRDLSECGLAIKAPAGLPAMPDIPGVSFFDLANQSERYLVEYFDLLQNLSLENLLEQHLLPWATKAEIGDYKAKENFINFVFQHKRVTSWNRLIAKFPIIPLASVGAENGSTRYACFTDVVNPYSPISGLYFKTENVFPDGNFFAKHKSVLMTLGVKSELSWCDVLGRIRFFLRCSPWELVQRVKLLLNLPVPGDSTPDQSAINIIRTVKWIPGTPPGEDLLCLLAPNECRGVDMSARCDFVLGTTEFSARPDWEKILGWDKPIEIGVLLKQLDFCLAARLHDKISEVLRCVEPIAYPNLRSKPCVLGKVGKDYRDPQRTFLPGSLLTRYPITPLLDEVDSLFEERHPKLIKALNLRKEPSLEDIIYVQKTVQESCQVLTDSDLGAIVSSLEISIRLHNSDELAAMLVPDSQSVLRSLSEIVHGDQVISGAVSNFNFVHPAVSSKVIHGLCIENALTRATRLNIAFEDEDEDEYIIGEKLTTVISDTLGRYSIESTFNEFLANAEDCGAKHISWILDECQDGSYPSLALLNPELAPFQGPALFVHNDGVFSDKDFAGFKDIGHGSKSDDAFSTGMFGRGALCMYHFTDVPMIISGGSLVILDPQQNLLPMNKSRKRKVGVRLRLSQALLFCPDQVASFHGLCGYSRELDYYKGTLFRFPFRLSGKTKLKENGTLIDATRVRSLLNDYKEDAQVALLFLRSVKTVDFCIRSQEPIQWRVSTEVFNEEVFRSVKVNIQKVNEKHQTTRTWRVGLINIDNFPSAVIKPGRGARKITNCGIAACISDPIARQKVFCTLPTPLTTHLPVAFHASFVMGSDRRTIQHDDSLGDSIIPKWNKWLLTTCIPKWYLEFLEDLTPKEGQATFNLWPARRTAGSSVADISDVVTTAFWELVQDSNLLLFPLADTCMSNLSPTLATRPDATRIYATTSLKAAQFDLLENEASTILRPLFLKTCPSLVRIPRRLWQDMREIGATRPVKELECNYLCDLFRDEANFQYLAEFLDHKTQNERSRAMKLLLKLLVPVADGDPEALKILDGCRILPLLDGTLGLLTLKSQKNVEWNFMASDAEQDLFRSAAGSFIDKRLFSDEIARNARNPLDEIMKGALNVRALELGDIGALLTNLNSPLHTEDSDLKDAWVAKLWKYLNQKIKEEANPPPTSGDMMSKLGLEDVPVYRAKSNGKWEYFSPRQFETGPYIIQSVQHQHRAICAEVPNLMLVDLDCFPSSFNYTDAASSLPRLMRALKSIEIRTKEPIRQFLGRTLSIKSRTILRDRILSWENKSDAAIINIFRDLPVWPINKRHKPLGNITYTSAANGLFCTFEPMLMPWIARLDVYVDPSIVEAKKDQLPALKIATMSIDQVWDDVASHYPANLGSVNSLDYLQLIRFVSGHGIPTSINIAPDGNGTLRETRSLYDHEDTVFSAAFREQKLTKFLHPDLQELRSIWISLGLRTRGSNGHMTPEECLDCALAIVTRKRGDSSQEFSQDAAIVADYLVTRSWPSWPENIRAELSRIKLFRVEEDVSRQKGFRQDRMRAIAAQQSYCSLREVGRRRDERIVWSQLPFFNNPSSDRILIDNLPDEGAPYATTVFYHLQYLINSRTKVDPVEIPDYLKDLQATYAYLQEEAGATMLITGIQEAKVFVNLDTTDLDKVTILDIESALTEAQYLCMNCPVDPLPIKVARKFLIPYEMLLRALGCHSVEQPRKTERASTTGDLIPMHHALLKIRDFRDQNYFIDVIFEAEGMEKAAHRIFMVVVSDYCRAQFSGPWGKLLGTDGKIRIDDMRFETLSQMVDFAYSGEVDWPPLPDHTETEEIATQLDEFLDLLQGADRWLITRLHEITEDYILTHADRYVRPDNVSELRRIASAARADRFVKHCDEFIDTNSALVALCEKLTSSPDEFK